MTPCRNPRCSAPETQADRGLCLRCERWGYDAILGLRDNYMDLGEELAPSMAIVNQRSSGSVDAPLPIRGDIEALMHDIYCYFRDNTPEISHIARLAPMNFRLMARGYVVSYGSEVMSRFLSVVLAAKGPEVVIQAMDLEHRVGSMLGRNRVWETRPMPCPDSPTGCGKTSLGTWVGSGKVECRSCGWYCTMEEYKMYVLTFVPRGRRP